MNKKYTYLIIIFLIIASGAPFGRIAGNDFVNYDDKAYITENSHIKAGINPESIKWAFTAVVVSNWHPVTLISHMLDWRLFGANASGHHLVSLLLHIGSVLLLFLFLNKATNNLWPSAFAAAFFALHPLRVESVAWAAERKDVLSMFFGMACIYAYAFYTEKLTRFRYFVCLILFALTLMSKPMFVTLPFVLMLLDYWPLKRWPKETAGELIGEKIPFLFLTIACCIITLWAQNKEGSIVSASHLHFFTRFVHAIVSYISYLGKIFWPVNLAVFYPYDLSLPLGKVFLSGAIFILITFAVLYYIKKLPFLFVGWFWYLGTFVPVIGLVQIGMQGMADRYTYLPSIGIAVSLAWGISFLFKHKDYSKKILIPFGTAVLITLAILTWQQCGYWENNFTLFSHALKVTKNNYMAHNNLAAALIEKGSFEEAFDHYNKALLIIDYDDVYYNRGNAYVRLGNYQLALKDYNKAISLNPNSADTYNNRGFIYIKLGRYQQAFDDYSKAISLKMDYAEAYSNRAFVYLSLGDNISGCKDARKACELGDCETLQAFAGKGLCR